MADETKKYVGENRLKEIFGYIKSVLPGIATTDSVGLVKVDGESTKIDSDGTIHSYGTVEFLKVVDGKVCAVYEKGE